MPNGQKSFFCLNEQRKHKDEKIIIYFVKDGKVMQNQDVLNFDHKDKQSTLEGPLLQTIKQ